MIFGPTDSDGNEFPESPPSPAPEPILLLRRRGKKGEEGKRGKKRRASEVEDLENSSTIRRNLIRFLSPLSEAEQLIAIQVFRDSRPEPEMNLERNLSDVGLGLGPQSLGPNVALNNRRTDSDSSSTHPYISGVLGHISYQFTYIERAHLLILTFL